MAGTLTISTLSDGTYTTSIRYVVTDGASGVDPLYCNVTVLSS